MVYQLPNHPDFEPFEGESTVGKGRRFFLDAKGITPAQAATWMSLALNKWAAKAKIGDDVLVALSQGTPNAIEQHDGRTVIRLGPEITTLEMADQWRRLMHRVFRDNNIRIIEDAGKPQENQ